MRSLTINEVISYAEKWDTNRKVSFYNKEQKRFNVGYARDIATFAVGIAVCVAALAIPYNFAFISWETAIATELSLIAVGFTVYALAFSFVKERYYGINVIDYALSLRPYSVPSHINMLIAIAAFAATFVVVLMSEPKAYFVLTVIVVTSMLDLLLALLALFSGVGKLHSDIRTFALERRIGRACSHPEGIEHYISDLFEDAARNNLQNNISKLEDDLYAIRCFYGTYSANLQNLAPASEDALSVLHNNTDQLLNLLARSGDYKHALILSRRCMSRLLANQLAEVNSGSSLISDKNAQSFDFSGALQNIFTLLKSVNIFEARLYDLVRDNLYVYAMTLERCEQAGIDAFRRTDFEELLQFALQTISGNDKMTDAEQRETLFRVFELHEGLLSSTYRRRDGQNMNMYYCDLKKYIANIEIVLRKEC